MTLADQIELVCLMEATARKPGNVHPAAAFSDLCYDDFVQAANSMAKPLAAVQKVGLGRAICDAVQATHTVTGTNVNLGIVLLLAPLAAVPDDVPLERGIGQLLDQTTIEDAKQVYAAIRLVQPGGMGQASSQDISQPPTVNLREAMSLAAGRDRIAEQYVTDFGLVFEARRKLCELFVELNDWEAVVVWLHVWMMSRWADTLIARKCGSEMAKQASLRAAALIDQTGPAGVFDRDQLDEFDAWLRADGHRRNPGTTADLIVATLFAALRDGLIAVPSLDEVWQRAVTIRIECSRKQSNMSGIKPKSR